MDELEDLSSYNGDLEHDMWADFTYHMHTGELPEFFGPLKSNNFEDEFYEEDLNCDCDEY